MWTIYGLVAGCLGLALVNTQLDAAAGAYDAGGSWWGSPAKLANPPWPGQYKLKPGDRDKLTAADVVGPDGIVYPNWKHVGVEGGIPKVKVVVKLVDLGAKPDTDISGLLVKACEQAAAKGGGAVLIDAGAYHLNQPVVIRQSGVVIRGAGKDKTKLIFRYGLDDPKAKFPGGWPDPSVFMFVGGGLEESRFLAKDGKRGDTTLTLKEIGDLKIGDAFVLRAPVTPRWQAITGDKSTGQWGTRTCMYEIRAIRGNVIDIGEALRIDYPVEDGTEIRRTKAIRRSGVEDFTIVHACRMPFATIGTQWAWECWVRGVDGIDSGAGGAHLQAAKRCEVRDCEFTGFDAKIHRANANWWGYAGFTQSQDCLMDNTVWHRFRHGPQVQFGAQGNVIRNSRFEGSDAQWHAGWATENLYENCKIGPSGPYGSYGFGMYVTDSGDTTHGPNGPRNVVYNCDVESSKDGVYARGATEGWIFLHNRFQVGTGGGIYADSGFFDAIFHNNIFVLKDASKPMLYIRTPDCVGWEFTGNTVYGGNGAIAEGAAKPATEKGNRTLPALKPGEALPERPQASPPSIYEWQRDRSQTGVRTGELSAGQAASIGRMSSALGRPIERDPSERLWEEGIARVTREMVAGGTRDLAEVKVQVSERPRDLADRMRSANLEKKRRLLDAVQTISAEVVHATSSSLPAPLDGGTNVNVRLETGWARQYDVEFPARRDRLIEENFKKVMEETGL